jgi:hypothetical protein
VSDWSQVHTYEMDWTALKLMLEGIEPGRLRKRYRLSKSLQKPASNTSSDSSDSLQCTDGPHAENKLPSEAEMVSYDLPPVFPIWAAAFCKQAVITLIERQRIGRRAHAHVFAQVRFFEAHTRKRRCQESGPSIQSCQGLATVKATSPVILLAFLSGRAGMCADKISYSYVSASGVAHLRLMRAR